MMTLAVLTLLREDPSFTIAIQPLGKISATTVKAVKQRLEQQYFATVSILRNQPLPKSAFYPPRSRYRADKLITFLTKIPKYDKIVGITSADISTTKPPHQDWGVFGLGAMPGKACIISSFRLKKEGKITPTERLCRVALHEVGHNLGLDHCKIKNCTMSDAEGSLKTVDEESGFCALCRRRTPQIR